MILRGILDRSLGGFVCLRGFASLGDLYDASQYDPAYQRELIREHGAEIAQFYNDKEYLFFPEIVLGTSTQSTPDDEAESRRFYNYLNSYLEPGDSESKTFKFSWCTIKVKEDNAPSPTDRRVKIVTRTATIDFLEPKKDEVKLLSRIDGNHRLSALDYKSEEIDGETFRNLNVPFCLMLFSNATEDEQYSRVIFHNINYKSIPLDKEENLKLILDNAHNLYSDNFLKNSPSFGLPYYFARTLINQLRLGNLSGIRNSFSKTYTDGHIKEIKRTALLNLCVLLDYNGHLQETEDFMQELIESIQSVNELYNQHTPLKGSRSQAVLLVMIYYRLTNKSACESFKNWVLSNYIYLSDDLDPAQLLKVFESIWTCYL